MGISLTDLTDEDEPIQMTMFKEQEQMDHVRGQKLDKAMDSLRSRFGSDIVKRGSVMALNIDVGRKHKGEEDKI